MIRAAGSARRSPTPCGSRSDRRYVDAVDALDAGNRARARKSSSASASSGARNGSRSEIVPAADAVDVRGASRRARTRSSLGVIAKTARIVSLNWRMLAKPAANAICANGSVGRLDQHPRGLRPLGAGQRDRTGADLGDELAVQVPLAVAEPAGEPGDALAVDDAVGDQPHRATDEVGPLVPLRRPGRRVGPAPLAGPEPGRLGGRGGRRRTARSRASASAPGSSAGSRSRCVVHRGEEPPVEPGVAALHRPVALFRIFEHGRSVTGASRLRLADIGQVSDAPPDPPGDRSTLRA